MQYDPSPIDTSTANLAEALARFAEHIRIPYVIPAEERQNPLRRREGIRPRHGRGGAIGMFIAVVITLGPPAPVLAVLESKLRSMIYDRILELMGVPGWHNLYILGV